MTETELANLLVDAHRRRAHDVDATAFAALDREAAYRVQADVLTALRQTAGMLKTAVHPDGVGVVAPIYSDGVSAGRVLSIASSTMVGIEVEVGVVLSRDLTAPVDEAQLRAAIERYFVGVEICGTRYVDRNAAGSTGGLADNMSALGYVIGATRANDDIGDREIRVTFNGRELYRAPAKHGFGSVLASLLAYANAQRPEFPLRAGTIVTTGSMCGLVPASGTGHVLASLGDEVVEFEIA